ncbi:unnamed protein product [Cuscuta epithymum]|uniref:C2H2-type domain-containing protein n=1 Tax=Cuscuta epithymum TaxID=186058 RepID=A0AAV0CTD0_9ASTE|nr:unnamed protein product [Cuscuta epithymum]
MESPRNPLMGEAHLQGNVVPIEEKVDEDEIEVCDVCKRKFASDKALFGHLAWHKDRGWRGAHKPRTFSIKEFAEYRELLVKSEEEQLLEIEAEKAALAAAPPPPCRNPLSTQEEAHIGAQGRAPSRRRKTRNPSRLSRT